MKNLLLLTAIFLLSVQISFGQVCVASLKIQNCEVVCTEIFVYL